jgi:hypothetical protein
MKRHSLLSSLALLCLSTTGNAQTAADAPPDLLTQDELQTMVAPIALYPDTLLMQVLVAATEPLDVMKADQHLLANADEDDEARKDYAESQDWDESVQVLTAAFPDVVMNMAEHIDWTESVGDAMLTQSDDVMDAIQAMRLLALDNGTLTSGVQQSVEVEEPQPQAGGSGGSTTTGGRTVVIQPTNPDTVYVPQYNPNTVYASNLGNVLAGTAVAFGTAALIDDIFDDDDGWDDYWGCHDCGGWNGRPPVVRQPDINVDGNVRIGNRVDIDRDNIAWKPDPRKVDQARTKLANHRGPEGRTRLPIKKGASEQDGLRQSIAARRSELGNAAPARRPQLDRPPKLTSAQKAKAIQRTKVARHAGHSATHRPANVHPHAVTHRPSIAKKPVVHHSSGHKVSALKKHAPAVRTRAASHRGHISRHHAGHHGRGGLRR